MVRPAPLAFRNPQVQRVRRLLARRDEREERGCFVIEGETMLAEALAAGAEIDSVFVSAGKTSEELATLEAEGISVYELDRADFARVADTVTPQGVLAVLRQKGRSFAEISSPTFVVVAVDVRDPGNAGAMVRSADAFGADAVVLCGTSVDPYNPKAVRASAGSFFHVPIVVEPNIEKALAQLAEWGLRTLATVVHGGKVITEVVLTEPIALLVGNEAHGLGDETVARADEAVTIPMSGRNESLNVAMATTALCYEVARQRNAA